LNIDIRDIDGPRKTAVISSELARLNVDIAALQETHLADYGSLREKEYTFFWQGKNEEGRREQGVGFAIRNGLLPMVEPGDYKSEQVMHIKLHTVTGTIHLVSAYAPTLTSSSDIKDAFYSALEDSIKRLTKNHSLIIIGDFNATVGDDQGSWPISLGHAGVGKCSEMVSGSSSSAHIISSALPIHSLQSRSSSAYPGCTQDPSIGTSWTYYHSPFHLRCLRRILSISWQDRITNSAERAGITSVYTLLRQRRLR